MTTDVRTHPATATNNTALHALADIRCLLGEAVEFLKTYMPEDLAQVSAAICGRAADFQLQVGSDDPLVMDESQRPTLDLLCLELLGKRTLLDALLRRRLRLLRFSQNMRLVSDEVSGY